MKIPYPEKFKTPPICTEKGFYEWLLGKNQIQARFFDYNIIEDKTEWIEEKEQSKNSINN